MIVKVVTIRVIICVQLMFVVPHYAVLVIVILV